MSKLQLVVVASAIFLFFGLYFGIDTKPLKQKDVEKTRSLSSESADINVLLRDAKSSKVSKEDSNIILALDLALEEANTDSTKIKSLKDLSRKWYELGAYEIAGFYAEQIAEMNGVEEAWSIAGTTYAIGIQKAKERKIKDYCTERAINAFESAISLNPSNTAHNVNLALCYAENPPQDNPMKGIVMLLDLNKKYPENVSVLTTLGRLAIKTGQYDKAVARLEKAISIDKNKANAYCLLAQAYEGLGDSAKAVNSADQCKRLIAQ